MLDGRERTLENSEQIKGVSEETLRYRTLRKNHRKKKQLTTWKT